MTEHPHENQPILSIGTPLSESKGVMILMHGRGAGPEDILSLAAEINRPDLTYLAPKAQANTWYPYPFTMPVEMNEPWLSSALRVLDELVNNLLQQGVDEHRLSLLGFSQGACLASEYAVRNPRAYELVAVLSGGLIGPKVDLSKFSGSFPAEAEVFLGCSDIDPHIPADRVHETAAVFEKMGASVTKLLYSGMGHTVNTDEIANIRQLLQRD